MPIRKCQQCQKEISQAPLISVKKWLAQKFCSRRCTALSRVGELIQRNKNRRKYPAIEGLTRAQVFYRHNPGAGIFHRDEKKRELVIIHLGSQCTKCGYNLDIRGLVLDHILGNGSEDRKAHGNKIYRYYVNHLEEAGKILQVLCATCNQIKAFENKEHNKSRRVIK